MGGPAPQQSLQNCRPGHDKRLAILANTRIVLTSGWAEAQVIMNHLVNLNGRHRQPIYFIAIIAAQAQVAGRDGRHRATGPDDLEMLHVIRAIIGDKAFQLFLEQQAHQRKATRVVVDVIE